MKCSIEGCPGEHEDRRIVHTVRRDGEVIVIDGVPAEVCPVCGDVLLRPETIRRIEELLEGEATPVSTAPLYQYV
jgi:YgiT-type zinc finger domain-containing protein